MSQIKYIIVQAGGKGRRLQHLTRNKPKALVPIENLPMLFHLFRQYPDKRFIIIADYKKEVLREYLASFAIVKYQVIDAMGTGTCSGISQALGLIPKNQSFMLIWSDLILPQKLELPEEYRCSTEIPQNDYIGISKSFPCRWSYKDKTFVEESSAEYGVAGFFLFHGKEVLEDLPDSGELVRWMKQKGMRFKEFSLAGTREFGTLNEYAALRQEKCRPFNRIRIEGKTLIKEPIDEQGEKLAKREQSWYQQAIKVSKDILPQIYELTPLKMEYIDGCNIYDHSCGYNEKKKILKKLVNALDRLHRFRSIQADSFSIQEAYYNKTVERLNKIRDMIPFASEKEITINGKVCRNIFFCKRKLERKLFELQCDRFHFIHGDCTFSNILLKENKNPILIDPRGYFGYTEHYGDVRYDWAKLYYSIVGNYDQFNLGKFTLEIRDEDVTLDIESNGWEDMEKDFFALTGAKPSEMKLLHAVIWLSLTTYSWQNYDAICGAFYNGLWYLEDVL